jgi:proteasome lid subunit RPN8/RPN11
MSERIIKLTRADYDGILAQARSAYPLEVCGLLAGLEGRVQRLYPVANRLASSYAYEMEPEEQIQAMLDMEDRGWEMLAIYHSHPHGPDTPSVTDVAKAFYPDVAQVIISLREQPPSVRAFLIAGGNISDIPLQVG